MTTQDQIVKINKAKKLDFNFYALDFTCSKYEALAEINETFYNDSYKKSAFCGLPFDEVIATHGSTDKSLLDIIKTLTEAYSFTDKVNFKYDGKCYEFEKGMIRQVDDHHIHMIQNGDRVRI